MTGKTPATDWPPDRREVVGRDGLHGTIQAVDPQRRVTVQLDGGRQILVSAGDLQWDADRGAYTLALGPSDIQRSAASANAREQAGERHVIPVIEEQVHVGKERVETGRVRVSKKVTEHDESIDMPLLKDEVVVERVAVNRPVDGDEQARKARQEGDVLIVPVLEEQLVVEKRLIVREELHIRRRQEEHKHQQTVRLQREEVDVQRLPPEAEGA